MDFAEVNRHDSEIRDYRLYVDEMTASYKEIIEGLKRHEIPECYPEAKHYPSLWGPHSLDEGSLIVRDEILRLCGYCYVAYSWIRPLAQWIGGRKCLEIMCGSGSLSKGLQDCGVNVKPTDNFSWLENRYCWFEKSWTEIEQIDCVAAIQKYGHTVDIVICSWPYMNEDCYHALTEMRAVNSALQMIFVGEDFGGATASDKFYDAAENIDDPQFYKAVSLYRSAFGLHDFPRLIR